MKTWKHACWATLALLCLSGIAEQVHAQAFESAPYAKLNCGDREKNYRERSYRAYLPVEEQENRLKIGISSYLENPTGICFKAGEQVKITVQGGAGQELRLIVHDFDAPDERWYGITHLSASGVQKTKINPLPSHSEYELQEGENDLIICNRGLGYLHYRSADPEQAPPVTVSIQGGEVNGVICPDDSAETCRQLLDQAKSTYIDLIGKRAQLVFWVEGIKKGEPEDAAQVISLYDRILDYIQDDIMGLGLYRAHPGGHILVRALEEGFMCAGEMGVYLAKNAFPGVASAKSLLKDSWGVAHELGHVHQTRPGLMWIGTVEVTNNICAMYVNYKLRPDHMRLEHSRTPNALGKHMVGGTFDCYVNNAITRRRLWQFQGAALPKEAPKPWEDSSRDVFVDLAPLWQLLLYNMEARGQKDFYPQIFENVRRTDESRMSQGELRVLFCKRACDAAQLDFSDFFVKTGILSPIDRMVNDYEEAHMTITRDMCAEAMRHAAAYPKPESSVIYYITVNNLPFFRDKLPVRVPEAGYTAPTIENECMEIPADTWTNAVAFEAYNAEGKLLHISLFGLNHADKSATTVICPAGTAAVKAVQWDGTRYTVFGKNEMPTESPIEEWLTRSNSVFSLHEAARVGHEETVQARLTGPIVKHNQYGWIINSDEKIDRAALINAQNENGDTPLHLAAAAGHASIVRKLLDAGADKSITNKAEQRAADLAPPELKERLK